MVLCRVPPLLVQHCSSLWPSETTRVSLWHSVSLCCHLRRKRSTDSGPAWTWICTDKYITDNLIDLKHSFLKLGGNRWRFARLKFCFSVRLSASTQMFEFYSSHITTWIKLWFAFITELFKLDYFTPNHFFYTHYYFLLWRIQKKIIWIFTALSLGHFWWDFW